MELQWVRATHQTRSRRTLGRILDAAEALLLERGFESVSVAEIAQHAESSVGAIYARFADKNGLLQCLHERFCEEAMETARSALAPARWREATAEEIISALTAFMVRVHSERAGLLRAFFVYGRNDPHFQQRDARLSEYFFSRLEALLLERRAEIRHPNPSLGISFGLTLVLGVLKNTFILCDRLPGSGAPELKELETELTRAYRAYLDLSPAAPRTLEKEGRGRGLITKAKEPSSRQAQRGPAGL